MPENKEKLVSIVTVCYNSRKTIEKAVKSVLEQTYSKIEYIIVDGDSTDGTLETVRKYQIPFKKRFGREIKIICEPDQGIYDAMNKGIKAVQGEIIGILNSDDYYEETAVETIISSMSESLMQVCYGGVNIYTENKLERILWLSHEFLEARMIAHPACFVSKAIYEKYGVFNIKYKSSADYEFMLRIYQQKDIEFVPVYKPIANYMTGGISTTSTGYCDKLKMLHDIGKIGGFEYFYSLAAIKIKQIFRI